MRSWKDRFESRRMVFPGMQARALFAKRRGGKPRTYAASVLPPFVLTMPPGAMNRPLGLFLPARGAQLSVNGKAATAKVFMQDRFGKPASSRCLAWSETWTKPRG